MKIEIMYLQLTGESCGQVQLCFMHAVRSVIEGNRVISFIAPTIIGDEDQTSCYKCKKALDEAAT